jgi:hypothetical protein
MQLNYRNRDWRHTHVETNKYMKMWEENFMDIFTYCLFNDAVNILYNIVSNNRIINEFLFVNDMDGGVCGAV